MSSVNQMLGLAPWNEKGKRKTPITHRAKEDAQGARWVILAKQAETPKPGPLTSSSSVCMMAAFFSAGSGEETTACSGYSLRPQKGAVPHRLSMQHTASLTPADAR